MNYYSTNNKSIRVSFREAVIGGLAPDGGLYMPETFPALPKGFLQSGHTLQEIGMEVAKRFIEQEIGEGDLEDMVREVLNFPIPLVPVGETTFSLELFHGPTLAFKDVGARFMSRMLSHFVKNEKKEICILTATSGDTGSAVANGFYGAEGIKVVILYPSGGVSELQEKQMTTLGKNITAIEVSGTFDDCQALVKRSFADEELRKKRSLTSANSINIARLIPQSFYYLLAASLLRNKKEDILFSVPSGNFGNLTAGILARKMGMNARFLAATNANDVFVKYLETGKYSPHPSKKTISNAMDVGNPSNFARLLDIYHLRAREMKTDISAVTITDEETKETIRSVYQEHSYLFDPHGAVGYCGLRKISSSREGPAGVVLATAHPAKFREVVESATGSKVKLPATLEECMKKEKSAVQLPADFRKLKEFLTK